MPIGTSPNARAFSKAAKALLGAAVVLLLLGIGMQRSRDIFEPILRAVIPFVERRGHYMTYNPATYPGYAVMPFVLSGVSVVFSGFAAFFGVASGGDRPTQQD